MPILETLYRDFRIGLRALAAAPGFSAVVILSLSLGIGASTVIFSIIDGLILRPVAIPHAERLMTIDTAASRTTRLGDSSYLDYLDYARQTKSFLAMVVYRRVT